MQNNGSKEHSDIRIATDYVVTNYLRDHCNMILITIRYWLPIMIHWLTLNAVSIPSLNHCFVCFFITPKIIIAENKS